MHKANKSRATQSLLIEETSHAEFANAEHVSQETPTQGSDIFVAAQYGDWSRIEQLIESKSASASDKNEQGITPLHWAAINGRVLACKSLLDNGAPVNAAGGDLNATPMMWAAKNGHPYVVHLLMTYGGDPTMLDNQGYNVLQLATHSSNIYLILYLLQADMLAESTDPHGHTCLMWAAYQGDALSVNLFLKWGVAVNAKDEDGLTALHWAVVRGNRLCIQRVIEEGGDLSARQKDGKTPRALAGELKTTAAFESALSTVGRESETGILVNHWFSDGLSMKLIFLLPYFYIGIVILLFSVAPIMIALPINMITVYGCHRLGSSVIMPPSMRIRGMQKTPYLAGIFSGSAFWTLFHWVYVLLPAIGKLYLFTNALFGITFALCLFCFFRALLIDPGFLPKNRASRIEQRETVEELLRLGTLDSRHFCIDCLIRKPLRSKHCKICQRCVAKHDHHCPWINSCVGLRNHRDFAIFVLGLFLGIPLFTHLVLLHVTQKGVADHPVECTLLASSYCDWLQIDAFGLLLAAWDCLQMSWVSMLFVVQFWQIGKGTTTQEVFDARRTTSATALGDVTGPNLIADRVASVISAGTTDTGTAALSGHGQGPEVGPSIVTPQSTAHQRHIHHHNHGLKLSSKISRLLGVDQFLSTAKEGLLTTSNSQRYRQRNPFDHGLVSNCEDFWLAPPPGIIASDGIGRVQGRSVDYYKLFTYQQTGSNV